MGNIDIQVGYQDIRVVRESVRPTLEISLKVRNISNFDVWVCSAVCELYIVSPKPSSGRAFLGEASAIIRSLEDAETSLKPKNFHGYRSRIEIGYNGFILIKKLMKENEEADLDLEIHLHGMYTITEEVTRTRSITAKTKATIPRSEWNKRLKAFGVTVRPLEISEETYQFLNSLLEEVRKTKPTIGNIDELIEWIYSSREKLL